MRELSHSLDTRFGDSGPRYFLGRTDIRLALNELLKAHEYALDVRCQIWDFAIEFHRLLEFGLTDTDLRWLIRKNYLEHKLDATQTQDDGRTFEPCHPLKYESRSCFVLTPRGVAFANQLLDKKVNGSAFLPLCGQASHFTSPTPVWDGSRRQLRVCDYIVKHFRWPAPNQEKVLATFHEDGWVPRIDDPLAPAAGQNPKQRLHDTIKCLNTHQRLRLIQFRGDGTGEGVVWQFTSQAHEVLGIDLPTQNEDSS